MADKRTDQLPDADPLDGSELIAVVQDGNSRKATTGDVAGMPHDHAIADVAGLATALAGKADAEHDHAIDDVTGLAAALDAKADAADVAPHVVLTQAEYDALSPPDPDTFYFIPEV